MLGGNLGSLLYGDVSVMIIDSAGVLVTRLICTNDNVKIILTNKNACNYKASSKSPSANSFATNHFIGNLFSYLSH